jgi:hypothetical protein
MVCSLYVGDVTDGLMLDIALLNSGVCVGLTKGGICRRSAVMVSRRSELRGSGQLMDCASVWAREGLVSVGLASMDVSDVGCNMALVIFPISLLPGDRGLAVCWSLFRVVLMLGFKGGLLGRGTVFAGIGRH